MKILAYDKIKSIFLFALLFVTIYCIIYQIFIDPIGAASNGDFYRMSHKVGLMPPAEDYWSPDLFWDYYQPIYQIVPPQKETGFFSSGEMFYSIALFLSRLLTRNSISFDLRWIGFTLTVPYIVSIIVAFYLLNRLPAIKAVLLGILLNVFFIDVHHIKYFNSFYQEGVSYVSLVSLLTLFFIFNIYIKRRFADSEDLRIQKICGFIFLFEVFWSCVFCLARYGNVLCVIVICFLLTKHLSVLLEYRIRKSRAVIISSLIILVSIFIPTITLFTTNSSTSGYITTFNIIEQDILKVSENPARLIGLLSVDKPVAELMTSNIGQSLFTCEPDLELYVRQVKEDVFNRKNEIRMLLAEPGIIIKMLVNDCALLFGDATYLGIFPKSVEHPVSTYSNGFDLFNRLKNILTIPSAMFFYGVVLTTTIYYTNKTIKSKELLTKNGVMLFIIVMLFSQFSISCFGDANEKEKHFFLTNILFYILFFDLIQILLRRFLLWITCRIASVKTEAL